jgi:hypothetical protein
LIAGLTGQSNAIELPAGDWEARLNELEVRLSDSAKIAENIADATTLYDVVLTLINESPPWVQSFYLDRLMRIRWSADVFLHLNERANLGWRELDSYIDERRELISLYPLDANRFLYGFITEDMDELTREVNSLIREQVLIQAGERIATAAEIDELYDSLNWLDDIALLDDQEVQMIRSKIELRIQEIEGLQQVGEFVQQIDAIQKISPELRAPAASMLLNDVTQYWLALEQSGLKTDDVAATHQRLTDYLISIRKQEEEESIEMLRGYRRWALDTIVQFEEMLEQHKRNAPRSGFLDDDQLDTQFFRRVRTLVRDHLFLINEVHLDYLLADQYRKALGEAISVLSEDNETAKAQLSGMIGDSVRSVRKNPMPGAPYHD